MDDKKFGVINEQGYLGEGFGFSEASEDDREKFDKKEDEDK